MLIESCQSFPQILNDSLNFFIKKRKPGPKPGRVRKPKETKQPEATNEETDIPKSEEPKLEKLAEVEILPNSKANQTEEEKIDEIIKASKELLSSEISKEIAEKTAQEIKSNRETRRHTFHPRFKLSRSTSLDSLVPLETGSDN